MSVAETSSSGMWVLQIPLKATKGNHVKSKITVDMIEGQFFFQFHVPFKIISLKETSQSIGGAKREYPGKTT